jgi:heme exporter protein A
MDGFPEMAFSGDTVACRRGGRVLFSGLGFRLAGGGTLLLRGANGIGKSSLLRIMAGLLAPAAGALRLDGAGADGDGEARAMRAYLGHTDALKPLATVAETLKFWGTLAHGAGAGLAIAEAARCFGLDPLAEMPCRYLSAGQRRRVALARVAAQGMPLWLLDEPTTALDDAGAAAFSRALAHHRAAGGMAVIAAHGALDAPGAEVLELARFAGGDLSDPLYRGLALDEEV